MKYLGVLVDSKLSRKNHINNLAKEIFRSIGELFKIRNFVSRKIMINLYYSLVYPHLLYGVQIWGLTFDTYLEKLNVLQKKIV